LPKLSPVNGGNRMIGKKFNRLKVLEFHHYDKHHRKHYLCRCDCGVEKSVQGSLLKSGNTKSCGCLGIEIRKTINKLPNDGGVINHIILQYKRHARNRKIEFHLTREEVDRLVRQPCHYCGTVGGNLKKTKNCRDGFRHNGIDRIDRAKPYISSNVVPCCGACNIAKGRMSREDFIKMAHKIVSYQSAMADQWG